MSDIKHAFRQIVLRPGLSTTVIVLLALGIGATTAMYSLIYEAILEPLPVDEPDELVSVTATSPRFGAIRGGVNVGGSADYLFSYPLFLDLEAGQRPFAGLAGHYPFISNVAYGEETVFSSGLLVSGNYFSVLNVQPALGRLLGPQDVPDVGESLVAVLSYAYWENRLGGDPSVVGETLNVNGQLLTVVGVAPEGFDGTMRGVSPIVYVPLTLRWLMQPEEPRNDQNRQAYWMYLFARLKPDISREQAEANLNGLYRSIVRNVEAPQLVNLTEQQRSQYLDGRIVLHPGGRGQVHVNLTASNPYVLALGATVLVLLIACVNIANLLLARGASRTGEMAIRASIGALRRRLVRQLLTECFVLAVIGGLLSLAVAIVTLRAIGVVAPQAAGTFTLSPEVALFAAGLTLATVLVFGLAPALSTGRADPAQIIKAQSAQSPGGRGLTRFRSTLVAMQISLSLVLLVLAGLFIQSLANVSRVDLGMDVDSVAFFSVTPFLSSASGERLDAVYDRVEAEVRALPGVESVAAVAFPLLYGFAAGAEVELVGADEQPEDNVVQGNPMISPDFFETLSIPLLAGRDFTDQDSVGTPRAVIVNEAFVQKFGLGNDAIGTVLRLGGSPYLPRDPVEIIGVVGDARYSAVRGVVRPQLFAPRPDLDTLFNARFFYLRSSLDADTVTAMIPEAIERVDPGMPVSNLNTMPRLIEGRTAGDRVLSMLSSAFAGLATVLAAIGLYGLLDFNVTTRHRELGLRLALGATPGGLRRLVLAQVGRMAALGGIIGIAAALALGRVVESMLFGLTGYDVLAFTSAVTVMGIVVLIASYVPARRAAGIGPMEALRHD